MRVRPLSSYTTNYGCISIIVNITLSLRYNNGANLVAIQILWYNIDNAILQGLCELKNTS